LRGAADSGNVIADKVGGLWLDRHARLAHQIVDTARRSDKIYYLVVCATNFHRLALRGRVSPYTARDGRESISASELAHRLVRFKHQIAEDAAAHPGSVAGLDAQEVEEFACLVEDNFSGRQGIPRRCVPYGRDILEALGETPPAESGKIAVLLTGVVEVQAPFESVDRELGERAGVYPVTVLRRPALIWLVEVIPQSGIRRHQVTIKAGVQSFVILLSLSQLAPWQQIAKRRNVDIDFVHLTPAEYRKEHTQLFKWVRGNRAPAFNVIASSESSDWNVELAILDIGEVFSRPFKKLSSKQQHLRDTLHRTAIRQLGGGLMRHVPGYRSGFYPTSDRINKIAKVKSLASFVKQLYFGEQPHHTCCSTLRQACNLFPAKALTSNVFEFIRLAGGQKIGLTHFVTSGHGMDNRLDDSAMTTFFNQCLHRYIYVPSFSQANDVCLYSPALWPHDDKNAALRSFDPRQVDAVEEEFIKLQNSPLTDLRIARMPDYFKKDEHEEVPKAISRIIMDGAIFFRKIHEVQDNMLL
jgi:hypothetical protein